jgi:hypothetical protein
MTISATCAESTERSQGKNSDASGSELVGEESLQPGDREVANFPSRRRQGRRVSRTGGHAHAGRSLSAVELTVGDFDALSDGVAGMSNKRPN